MSRPFRRSTRDPHAPPKEPFFKDAKILHGRIRADVSVRFLLVAIAVFVLTVALGALYLNDQGSKTSHSADQAKSAADTAKKLAASNRALVKQVQAAQKSGHAERLRSEAETKAQVRELACFFWNYIQASPDVGLQRVAKQIDTRYSCKLLVAQPPTRGGGTRSTPTPAAPLPTPGPTGPSAASSAPRASRSPAPKPSSSTPQAAAPAPVTVTPKPKSTGIVDLGPLLCTLKLATC